jgi:hypothetical protein
MATLNLLFDQFYEYFGDISVSNGKFSNATLTKRGEERFGRSVTSWRRKGIPVRVEVFGTKEHPHDILFGKEMIMTTDKRFEEALRKWADDEHLLVLSLNPDAVSCWEMLIQLPFEGAERFALALSLCKATRPQLEKWKDGLHKTLDVHEAGEKKIREKVSEKRKKSVAKLLKN